MIRLNYRDTSNKIISKTFESLDEAYWYAVNNIATKEDKEWYQDICGETFKSIIEKEASSRTPFMKVPLMAAILRNSMENVVMFEEV